VVALTILLRQKIQPGRTAEALRLLARLAKSSSTLQTRACEHNAIRSLAALLLAPTADAEMFGHCTWFCGDMLAATFRCLACLCLSQGASCNEHDLLCLVLPKAVDALNHSNLAVANAALTCFLVLGRLHSCMEFSDLMDVVQGPLLRLLTVDSADVREQASLGLATIVTHLHRRAGVVPPDALKACVGLVLSEDHVLVTNGLTVLESVVSGASDCFKEQVAQSLGDPLMRSLCHSDDVEVRLRALHFRISMATPATYNSIEDFIDGCFDEAQEHDLQHYMNTMFGSGRSFAAETA
jgi:hypothetical protein